MSFNKVILLGNLTRDPDTRQTQSGTLVCRLSIAVNRNYTATDGTAREEVCFVDVECFGKTAENVSKYFNKGKPILIEGRLRQDTWDDKTTGQKRSKLVIVLERFEFVGGGSGGGTRHEDRSSDYDQSTPPARGGNNTARDMRSEMEDDDVPF